MHPNDFLENLKLIYLQKSLIMAAINIKLLGSMPITLCRTDVGLDIKA